MMYLMKKLFGFVEVDIKYLMNYMINVSEMLPNYNTNFKNIVIDGSKKMLLVNIGLIIVKLGPVPRSGFSGLFLEKPILIFVVGQRSSCGLKELNLY
jgi:hypothetical protein